MLAAGMDPRRLSGWFLRLITMLSQHIKDPVLTYDCGFQNVQKHLITEVEKLLLSITCPARTPPPPPQQQQQQQQQRQQGFPSRVKKQTGLEGAKSLGK